MRKVGGSAGAVGKEKKRAAFVFSSGERFRKRWSDRKVKIFALFISDK